MDGYGDLLDFFFSFPETYVLLGLYGYIGYRWHWRLQRRSYRSLGGAVAAGMSFWLVFLAGLLLVLAVDYVVIIFHVAATSKVPL